MSRVAVNLRPAPNSFIPPSGLRVGSEQTRRQDAKLQVAASCKLGVYRNTQLPDQAEHCPRAFIAHGGYLRNLISSQILESHRQINDCFDFVQRRASGVEILPKLLCPSATGSLGDVQNDTGRGAPPLIGKIAAFCGRQAIDERFGNECQRACVLPGFQVLVMTHAPRMRNGADLSAPNSCTAWHFLAACTGSLKPLATWRLGVWRF